MKNLLLACVTVGSLIICACGHHAREASVATKDSLALQDSVAAKDSVFFPVADVLASEIRTVDSTPTAKKEYLIRNGRTDSAFLTPAEFDALAAQFLAPELRDGSFEKNFTEHSFIDNATQEATFTYSTANGDLPLQRVDVVTAPKGDAHYMKSIYLERKRKSGDSSILDKMYWRSGSGFEVIRTVSQKGGTPAEQQVKVVWGDEGNE